MNQDVKMWGSFLYFAECSHSLITVYARGKKQILFIFLIGYWSCIPVDVNKTLLLCHMSELLQRDAAFM